EVVGQGPAQPGGPGPAHVVADRRERQLQRGGHLAKAEPLVLAQPQDFSDLAHADMGTGQGHSSNVLATVRARCPALTSRQHHAASDRVYENPGIGVRIRSESVYENLR